MTDKLAGQLDLEQAWRRAKWDLTNRNFVTHPYEVEIIEPSLGTWLDVLRTEIATGACSPKACEICAYPKPGFQIRPAARLELQDYVLYCALGQEVVKCVSGSLRALVNTDYSYQLRASVKTVPWFTSRLTGWKQFARASLRRIDRGASYVVFTDLVGFYENIDLERLRYALLSTGLDEDVLRLLMKCLRKWSGTRSRGIPQGTSVSDLLAKLYLEPLDQRLRREGFEHLRYVDDMRVFCGSMIEAKKAIQVVSSLTREVGLNLQSAKTKICPATEARGKIQGAVPEIEELEKRLVGEARTQIGWASPYLYPEDLRTLRQQLEEGATAEAIETAFRERFDGRFDASLYHYLLRRLGAIGSRVAVDHATRQLLERPEETAAVLEYFKDLDSPPAVIEEVVRYMESAEAIYDFQRFQILRWLFEHDVVPCPAEVLGAVRKIVRGRGAPLWLRGYAIALQGRCGDRADLEALEELYAASGSELERAIILCALERMHKARRNAAYARAGGDGFLAACAIRWVQSRAS